MKNYLTLLICMISLLSCKKDKVDYMVYQYEGLDSLNGHIAKEIHFNEDGLVKFEKVSGFKETKYIGNEDVEITHFYKDTLRIKTLQSSQNSIIADSTRIEYKYDSKNHLIQKSYYDYKKRIKRNKQLRECNHDSTDFESKSSWALLSRVNFKYDEKGRRTEYYAENIHWDSQNHYYYEYDSYDRLVKEISLNHEEFIWENHYDYKLDGYDFYQNQDSTKKIESKKDWPHFKKIRYVRDNFGNILEETEIGEFGTLEHRIIRKYNKNNRISKEERFNGQNNLVLTNIYKYE